MIRSRMLGEERLRKLGRLREQGHPPIVWSGVVGPAPLEVDDRSGHWSVER